MRNLLITGGAGYLGRAILRWLQTEFPDVTCTIYSRDEGKHSKCRRTFPHHRYVLGDVRDYDRLEAVMAGHDTVIHAAAFKYVPQAETNVSECVAVNVDGSRNVVKAAIRADVDRVIGISTDKACQPANVYGVTKLMMERLFQEGDAMSPTSFQLVRYGNVVSSTGSVIPIFRDQLRNGGVITLTNPAMTRFWLSVEQAVALVKMALGDHIGGAVIIPRLPSLTMKTLAEAVSQAYAMKCETTVIGHRPGEKVHEELVSKSESDRSTIIDTNIGFDCAHLYPAHREIDNRRPLTRYISSEPNQIMDVGVMANMIKGCPE